MEQSSKIYKVHSLYFFSSVSQHHFPFAKKQCNQVGNTYLYFITLQRDQEEPYKCPQINCSQFNRLLIYVCIHTHTYCVHIYTHTHIHTYRVIQIDALLGKYIHLLIYIQGRSVHFSEVYNKVISGKRYWGNVNYSIYYHLVLFCLIMQMLKKTHPCSKAANFEAYITSSQRILKLVSKSVQKSPCRRNIFPTVGFPISPSLHVLGVYK